MIPTPEQFAGFIVGQCLGDALGFLIEGEAPNVCARYAAEVVRPGRLPRRTRDGYAFGQYSDCTQMARELMESYIVCLGFDPTDYAQRIAALFSEDRVVGRGHAMQEAARRLAEGVPWQLAAAPPPLAGNASAVRAGIIGLLCADDPERMLGWACRQSAITHADSRCSAGAAALAGAVTLAARQHTVDASFLTPLQQWSQRIDPALATALKRLEELLQAPPMRVAEAVSRLGLPPGVDSQWRGGVSAFVISSVTWGLYAFLKHPDEFTAATALAIEAGGDVGSTAAMAGGLVGARHGLGFLPQDLALHLNDHGNWRFADLVELARACHEVASRS